MDFDEWEPAYEAILADFGFDRAADERSRDLLADLVADAETFPVSALDVGDRTVAVAGAAPTLESELDLVRNADAVFAASTAADRLVDAGLDPDCVVTDLDKHAGFVREATRTGTPVAVHAHGDNEDLIGDVVPDCDVSRVVPTTQAAPVGPVCNFGGFTDGDRAAFLADHLGAGSLAFPGWDFDDAAVGPAKARKLNWAARLLRWLERRRGERFDVLDGRRADIDADALPFE